MLKKHKNMVKIKYVPLAMQKLARQRTIPNSIAKYIHTTIQKHGEPAAKIFMKHGEKAITSLIASWNHRKEMITAFERHGKTMAKLVKKFHNLPLYLESFGPNVIEAYLRHGKKANTVLGKYFYDGYALVNKHTAEHIKKQPEKFFQEAIKLENRIHRKFKGKNYSIEHITEWTFPDGRTEMGDILAFRFGGKPIYLMGVQGTRIMWVQGVLGEASKMNLPTAASCGVSIINWNLNLP